MIFGTNLIRLRPYGVEEIIRSRTNLTVVVVGKITCVYCLLFPATVSFDTRIDTVSLKIIEQD